MRTAILLAVLALATTASAQTPATITATERDRNWSKASTAYAYRLERINEKHLHKIGAVPVKNRKDKTTVLGRHEEQTQLPAAESGK